MDRSSSIDQEEQFMAQVTIPDELAERVRARGEDLTRFTAHALQHELMSIDEDPIAQAELTRLTTQGKAEMDAGKGTDGPSAIR
jgi:post-segregation antitoxin (ccd killing protein)